MASKQPNKKQRKCPYCDKEFVPRNAQQVTCSEKDCQKGRKLERKRERYATDPAFRERLLERHRAKRLRRRNERLAFNQINILILFTKLKKELTDGE